MSKPSNVGDNPNDKLPPGKPLAPDELASGRDDAASPGAEDDGLGPADEDEDEPGLPLQGDPENQAGSDGIDRDKFRRG